MCQQSRLVWQRYLKNGKKGNGWRIIFYKSHEIVYVAERVQQTFPKGAGMKEKIPLL